MNHTYLSKGNKQNATGIAEEKGGRKHYIDIIRAIAVMDIFFYHFWISATDHLGMAFPAFSKHANGSWGSFGVFLFFMISGNVIYTKYGDKLNIISFYKARFFKIYPMFWFTYAFFFLFTFWQGRLFPNGNLINMWQTIVGMDGLFIVLNAENFYILGEWFLGTIILIYLIYPLIRLIMKRLGFTVAILFLFSSLIYYNNFFNLFTIVPWVNIFVCIFYFCYGSWIERQILKLKYNIRLLITALFVILSIVLITLPMTFVSPQYALLKEHFVNIILCSSVFMLTICASPLIEKLPLIMTALRKVSDNSYTIFLCHHVIIAYVTQHFMADDYVYSLKGILSILVITIALITAYILFANKIFSMFRTLMKKPAQTT
jgi:peptidoglycan/LPS O-acetylase OafA/YrhL